MGTKSAFRSCERMRVTQNNELARGVITHDVTARRLRASPPAIKTLKVPSILLDHDFKSHILSAYLNENPDCAALPKRREARCDRESRELLYQLLYQT